MTFFDDSVDSAVAAAQAAAAAVKGRVRAQSVAPDPSEKAWVDTSTVPPVLKGWNGTIWVPIGGGGGGSSAPAQPAPAVGQYLLPWNSNSAGNPTVAAMAGNTNNPITPLRVPIAISINALMCRVMTGQAGVNAKMLLYGSDANSQPGSLIVASAGFSCASGAINELAIATTALTPGFYWATVVTDTGTTVAFLGGKATDGQGVTDTNGFVGSGVIFRANCGTYASPAATASIGSMLDGGVMPTVALKRSA